MADGHQDQGDRPSLVAALAAAIRRRGTRGVGIDREWRTTLRVVTAAAALALGVTGAGRWMLAAWSEAPAMSAGAGDDTADDRAALARLYAAPDLDGTLVVIGRHLPAGVRLASAARDEAGRLRFSILTTDPDLLRGQLRADPWFARFGETRQSIAVDGRIEMTLEQRR